MPELPEVERAAKLLRSIARGKRIAKVDAVEDTIVFAGATHTEFMQELEGRQVKDVKRYGKVFYMELDGDGRVPVLHFGMTGMLQVKGQLATYYKETPRKASTDWPPRFMKFILHIEDEQAGETVEVAFLDARRLGRIRLVKSPMTEPPISTLGFDPILSMPSLEDYKCKVLKRNCPIKALLLDQSFSAGVGNWVADEILYHSRIHPERRTNSLEDTEVQALHKETQRICQVAVEANADDSKFPEDWLFKHRWGKGKKKHSLVLPTGEPATIKWITVGGRTSAYVAELQKLNASTDVPSRTKRTGKRKQSAQTEGSGSDSDLTPLEDEYDSDEAPIPHRKRKASSPGSRSSRRTRKKV